MGFCEVIKANVVFADEIFRLTDERTVDPNLGTLTGPFTGTTKICVLEFNNIRCENNKIKGSITFAISEELKVDGKDLEFFFRLKKDVTFQKPDCPGTDIINALKAQIKWVKGTNVITIITPSSKTFTQKIDIDVKVILEEERILCVGLCPNSGELTVSSSSSTTLLDC